MVAYSFQKQFVDPILSGRKTQTIRAVGLRIHAQEGSGLQLYTAMRTKQCRLIGRAECLQTLPIRIDFSGIYPGDVIIIGKGPRIWQGDLEPFAQKDGFRNWDEMRKLWDKHHPNVLQFHGVLIRWKDFKAAA